MIVAIAVGLGLAWLVVSVPLAVLLGLMMRRRHPGASTCEALSSTSGHRCTRTDGHPHGRHAHHRTSGSTLVVETWPQLGDEAEAWLRATGDRA